MSALDTANGRVNFNGYDFRGSSGLSNNMTHDMSSYSTQQSQNSGAVGGSANQYNYEPNAMPVKSEDSTPGSYGRPTLPNVDGMSNAQGWNGSFNTDQQDNYLMTSSMASGPIPGKTSGVLTVNNF
jgi:hypothetical protein